MKTIRTRTWYGVRRSHDFSEEIDRGIKLLDREAPGWPAHIDVDRLDMMSNYDCVLAQLAGPYGWARPGEQNPFTSACLALHVTSWSYYGFAPPRESNQWAALLLKHELKRQWTERILARQESRQRYALAR
jgi:hypothetical protein